MSRQYDNYGRDQYNIENVDTLNVVNHADRNVSLDDWKPSFEHMQGRKEAIAELNIALADPKKAIACIVGLGGYGKSTLAAKLFDGWEGGRFWADLSQRSRDFREFATRAIAQLGQKSLEQVNNLPEAQLGYELAAVLQGQGYLVVLDNLESLLDGDGNLESVLWREFLQNWANDGESSKVLITTREEPNLPKLRFSRYELRDGLEEAEGAAVLRDFGILGTVAELVAVSQRVGGIPLSLMLIVGLLCNDYEEEPNVRFLPEDLFGIEGAHRLGRVTTEVVFRASFERLEPRLQSLLMAVSVFAKPFDRTMAAAMIADEEVTDRDLLLLKKRGFVLAESGCYRFQPQIQELVQRQAGDLPELHRRAISFYLTLCEAKSTLDPRYDTLEDADPYLQIFHHYCELGEYESAFYVLRNDLNKVDTFLSLHGYYERLVNLYSLLVKSWRLDQLQKLEYTDALINLGNAYRSSGQYQKAIFYHQQSLQISQSIGNKLNELGSLGNLGLTYYFLGQYQESLSFHQQALQISRIIFDKNGEAKSLGNLGSIYGCLEQYDKSIESHLSALAITREIDDRFWEAGILCNLGIAYYCLEQYQESLTFHQQSLKIKQEIGDKKGEANSLGSLGNVYCSLEQYKEAINFYQKSLKMLHMMDDKHSEAAFLDNLGLAYYSLKQYREALSCHQQSLGLRQIIGDRLGEAASLGNIGNVNYYLGLYQEAINFYQQSLEIKRSISDRRGEVDSLINLAIAHIQVGKLKEGIDSGLRVLKISQELKLPLKAMPYPNWYKSIIRFAQRGKWQIALCFCIGLFAFPLFLAYQVALLLWRLIKEKVKSRK